MAAIWLLYRGDVAKRLCAGRKGDSELFPTALTLTSLILEQRNVAIKEGSPG